MSHASIQVCGRHRKHLPFRYPALTSKPKTGPREIFLDASYLLPLRNPETPETKRISLKNIQYGSNTQRYGPTAFVGGYRIKMINFHFQPAVNYS
ncbi:unnamed protein product [Hymenolepis diminuta]|uniref:Uncharacterized protein n=1 Tax=Hymenolepis diminuta TaxID=6216 RepID=A0A564YLW7_HYMDI|nr:unnamed protein product [Hymenolepis diminuta]